MNQREAKAYACSIMGREARALQGSAEWAIRNHFTGEEFTDIDRDRVAAALSELSDELTARGRQWGLHNIHHGAPRGAGRGTK